MSIIDDAGLKTMDKFYEEAFGPALDARKKAAKAVCEKLDRIPGVTGLGPDENWEVFFSLIWQFRGEEHNRHFAVRISPFGQYKRIMLKEDEEAKALLAKDKIASILAMFFLQFGGWLNVRYWPPCQKCSRIDITIDVTRNDFDNENVACFPIFERKHFCPKHNKK